MRTCSTVLAGLFVAAAAAVSLASGGPDGAILVNSGSTNTPGYTIKVWSDGRAVAAAGMTRAPRDVVARLFADLRAAKRAGSANEAKTCMKSASFGSSTVARYHGWSSDDLECPGNDPLTADAHALAAAVQPVTLHRRLPNEIRRPEASPAAQPSASPESRVSLP
ncbi:MAG: hypothetical protein ABR508_08350 [Candidatus Baltobacteraceae bacterium]